ncbi:MAG: cysteine hydrolase family protein [Bacteroidota bacterium]
MHVLSTALLVIDVQQGLGHPKFGQRNNPDAEQRMAALLTYWRAQGGLVVHVQHASTSPDSPLRPDLPGFTFKPEVQPRAGEAVFTKRVNSAFIGTDLEGHLRSAGTDAVVVIGLTTDHCVSSSARMASDLGFTTYVVSDATATFERTDHTGRHYPAEEVHAISLLNLHNEFATILSTTQILAAASAVDYASAM